MKRRFWLAAAVVLPRLAVFFVNQNLGGDAIARTVLAHRWLAEPHLMTSFADGGRQFGPLHLYLLALAEWLWSSPLHAGRVVSLVAGVLTAWPLFTFTARRFGTLAAEFAVVAFACWGFHLQASTTSASEALNLLLVMGAVACFDVATDRRSAWWGAALLLNLACATRYDSWALVPLLALVEWWRSKRFWRAFAFGAASSVFAVSWLAGEQRAMGDALYSIRYIDQYHRDWWRDEAAHWGVGLYRLACAFAWPGAALAMLTPALAIPGFIGLVRTWRERVELRWLVVLVVLPGLVYGLRGALLSSFAPLARFTAKEVLFLLPFAGWMLHRLSQRSQAQAGALVAVGAAWCLGLAVFCFSPDTKASFSLRPIAATSRLEEPLRSTTEWLQSHAAPGGGLLVVDVDPRGFDDLSLSYFSGFPLESQLRRRHDRFDDVLGDRVPRWILRFDSTGPTTEFRGHSYVLRYESNVFVYELTPPA